MSVFLNGWGSRLARAVHQRGTTLRSHISDGSQSPPVSSPGLSICSPGHGAPPRLNPITQRGSQGECCRGQRKKAENSAAAVKDRRPRRRLQTRWATLSPRARAFSLTDWRFRPIYWNSIRLVRQQGEGSTWRWKTPGEWSGELEIWRPPRDGGDNSGEPVAVLAEERI